MVTLIAGHYLKKSSCCENARAHGVAVEPEPFPIPRKMSRAALLAF